MQIFRAFRARHPICAATVGFLFGPDVAMAYLGRGWTAIAYVISSIIVVAVQFWLFAVLSIVGSYEYLSIFAWRLIGMVHGYRAAKKLPEGTVFPWYSLWYSLILIFLVAELSLAVLVKSFLFQPFTIPSGSMLPTLQSGDYVIAQKYAYGYSHYTLPYGLGPRQRILGHGPDRGDVVIYRQPMNPGIDFVKRVVGLPGDRIQMKSGTLYLNGTAVQRELADDFTYQSVTLHAFRETLPSGRSYTIVEQIDTARGDNTEEFVVPAGHYFMLGDNRDNSLDSRFDAGGGFVPDENIYAKAAIVLFNSVDTTRQMGWIE